MAQVAGHDVKQRAAVDVARAEHLPQVPLASGLTVELLLGEHLGPLREVTAEDDRVRAYVAGHVRGEVAKQHG